MVILLLSVVACLSVIQIPLDLRRHLLSRRSSQVATIAVSVIIASDSIVRRSVTALILSLILTTAVTALYALVHRRFPKSLGFGDVLLVIPLSLSLSYVAPNLNPIWQLASAISGAIHAFVHLKFTSRRHIPFGPHLLFWAVVILTLHHLGEMIEFRGF